MAGDRRDLIRAASDLGKTASRCLAPAVRGNIEAARLIAQLSEPISKPGRGCPAARARQICRVGAEQVSIIYYFYYFFPLII
jgi:hypothetical protein